jgi:hypothetical protein
MLLALVANRYGAAEDRDFYLLVRLHDSIAALLFARSFGSSSVMCGSSEKVPATFVSSQLRG